MLPGEDGAMAISDNRAEQFEAEISRRISLQRIDTVPDEA
jgi:hypothetical protein